MSAAASDLAAIDVALARGEWWVRLFDELSDLGLRRAEALTVRGPKGLARIVETFERLSRGVRLAVVAAMRLDQILSGLAELRKRSAADTAAARARARAKAEADAARQQAREQAREQAKARREARMAEDPGAVIDSVDRTQCETRDRDPLVAALDRRLAAVDPVLVDFDDLQLREVVARICADLGVAPDWTRWEAGDWAEADAPAAPKAAAAPVPAPPSGSVRHARNVRPPPILPDRAARAARADDTALARVLLADDDVAAWRPRLE